MRDFSFFDSLIDAVFVLNRDKNVVYCNNSAATMCGSSIRRLCRGTVKFYEAISLEDQSLFVNPQGTWGEAEAVPLTEMSYTVPSNGTEGKIQVVTQPFSDGGETFWAVILHDVTLEERLHSKYQGELVAKEEVIQDLEEARSQLELYSKNLEKMVEERTIEVKQANVLLQATMNSLGQGFVVFDQEGVCHNFYTRACESILEALPAGQRIWEVLRLGAEESEQFKKWLQLAFSEALPFESLKDLVSDRYLHSQGRHIALDYHPVRDDQGRVKNLVLVATDKTVEVESQRQLEQEKKSAQAIVKILKSKSQFSEFIESSSKAIKEMIELVDQGGQENLQDLYRRLHTLEGEAGVFHLEELRLSSRRAQESLKERGVEGIGEEVRDLKEKLEGFLQGNRAILEVLGIGGPRRVELLEEDVRHLLGLSEKYETPRALRDELEQILLMQPLDQLLGHFDGLVQLVAEKTGKSINPIKFKLNSVRVQSSSFKGLVSSLVHVFRNAVDHGLESPEEREMLGKSRAGQIEVSAEKFQRQGEEWIRLCFTDDGQGIDPTRIRSKLAQKSSGRDWMQVSDEDLIQEIFSPGFSSRDSVGEWSGRGVGLDALKAEVELLGGQVWVESSLGQGTKFVLEVPNLRGYNREKLAA